MKKRFYLFLPIYFGFFAVLGAYEVVHPPFSTDSTRIGNYEIKIETTPPVPEVAKNTQIHFLVLDQNGNPVDNFRIGIQIYYNDVLQSSFLPADHNLGRYDLDYTFSESGNHVIRVDLYDLKNGQILSHAFNVGVLNVYMNMFTYLVIAGVSGATGIVLSIILYQKKFKLKR
ncbi:MAG: FixH family protein [Thaumarchaeota archaeon]|nr:FixH family protein [Nitrososphaerota archaeon]